jgi:Omp85 superfamily domain
MKLLFLMAVPVAALLAGTPGEDDPAFPTNINSRYTIEKVSVSGFGNSLISTPLRTEIDHVVGEKLDQSRLEKLADRMKKELHVSDVAVKVTKGTAPDHVLVTFDVKSKEQRFDLNVAKFLYDAEQGWSGEGTATTRIAGNTFSLGLVSDGDALLERFAGLKARYQRDKLGTKWLGLRFEFDTFHDQWNPATLAAVSASGNDSAVEAVTYRDRQVFTPEARLYLAEPLELDFGVRFARYWLSTPGANTESSNAVVSTLRYHQRWGSDGYLEQQELEGSYSFEDATHDFESDPVYQRHIVRARYKLRHGRGSVQVSFLGGRIYGQTPLFDRFVLGDSSTLRGWSKFDLDPLGGSRVAHGSIDCLYRFIQVFYDTGAVWDRTQDREQKQSLGTGLRKDNFQLAVAFPIRPGRVDPTFFAGMNF